MPQQSRPECLDDRYISAIPCSSCEGLSRWYSATRVTIHICDICTSILRETSPKFPDVARCAEQSPALVSSNSRRQPGVATSNPDQVQFGRNSALRNANVARVPSSHISIAHRLADAGPEFIILSGDTSSKGLTSSPIYCRHTNSKWVTRPWSGVVEAFRDLS